MINKNNIKVLFKISLCLILVTTFLLPIKTARANSNINILFIGNSSTYYNNMPKMVGGLAKADQLSINVESITAANYTLEKFSTTSNTYHKKIVNALNSKSYEYVILQDNREEMIQSTSKAKSAVKSLKSLIDENGATTILYETQADKEGRDFTINNNSVYFDHDMIDYYLAKSYFYIGNKYSLNVATSGINFSRCMNIYPGINLYNSDNLHPKVSGSYLAACSLYKTIFNKTPLGNAYLPGSIYDSEKLLDGLSLDHANQIQKIADASLKFSSKTIKLNKGTSKTTLASLSYTAGNDSLNAFKNNIEYRSIDDGIISINKNTGYMTAINTGETMVMASSDNGLLSFCNVKVLLPSTLLTLKPTGTISLNKNESLKITATMSPADTTDDITWTSSNKKIVSISSSGKIKALKLGVVKITATTTSGIKLTRQVRVRLVKPTKIKIRKTSASNKKRKYKNLHISWKKNPNAVKYFVYKKKKGGTYKKIATVKTNSYTNKNVLKGKKYYYKIKSIYSNTKCNSFRSKAKSIIL
ncbi:MAG: Ig-like domain-containing protein [Eubacterium sp.]|nr:Ig-like domain-containing protein [Eubacterium sp.]